MATATRLIDVPEYLEIPDPPGGRYELHHGQLFEVSFAKIGHSRVQDTLVDCLRPFAAGRGRLRAELAFRALPHYELRAADVGYVIRERDEACSPDDYLYGAPDLMIEVVSPSNRKGEMNERKALCLANGCSEFWTVDPKERTVIVDKSDGSSTTYRSVDVIPLTLPAPGKLRVDDIFTA